MRPDTVPDAVRFALPARLSVRECCAAVVRLPRLIRFPRRCSHEFPTSRCRVEGAAERFDPFLVAAHSLVRCLTTLRLFAPEAGGRRARPRERLRHLPYGVTGGTFGDGALAGPADREVCSVYASIGVDADRGALTYR